MASTLGDLLDIGVLKSTILPNFAFSSSLILPTYLLQRLNLPLSTRSFWTAATLGNVVRLAAGPSFSLSAIPHAQKLFLAGLSVSALGLVFNDVRALNLHGGRGRDKLYTSSEGPAPWSRYIYDWGGKILAHTLITLPLVLPFSTTYPVMIVSQPWTDRARTAAIGLWAASTALQILSGLDGVNVRQDVRHPE